MYAALFVGTNGVDGWQILSFLDFFLVFLYFFGSFVFMRTLAIVSSYRFGAATNPIQEPPSTAGLLFSAHKA
jgi:hypothetical protein